MPPSAILRLVPEVHALADLVGPRNSPRPLEKGLSKPAVDLTPMKGQPLWLQHASRTAAESGSPR